jgi:hypothetical protein
MVCQQFCQLGDIRRDPPRLGRMYAGRGLTLSSDWSLLFL